MKKGMIILIALLVLLSATAITFARNTAATSVTITAGGITGYASDDVSGIAGVATSIKLKNSTGSGPYVHVAPTWTPVIEQAGAITGGDVYYLNTTDYTGDILVTLYLTNPNELQKNYSNLMMKVNVWKRVLADPDDPWVQATMANGDAIVDTMYLTINNGNVSFILTGDLEYCISVDGGSYYCIDTNAAGGELSPAFFLEVQPV